MFWSRENLLGTDLLPVVCVLNCGLLVFEELSRSEGPIPRGGRGVGSKVETEARWCGSGCAVASLELLGRAH